MDADVCALRSAFLANVMNTCITMSALRCMRAPHSCQLQQTLHGRAFSQGALTQGFMQIWLHPA